MVCRHYMLLSALCGLTFSYTGMAAHAQSTESAASTAATSDGKGGLEEIVVTARRREETLQQTPLSISALSADKLQQMNMTRIDDISEAVPNLNISQNVSYTNGVVVYMRGVGDSDSVLTNDSPVAMYIDGVYVARTIGALFNFVDLERIEVLRGPQGSLFGRNTTGGAVNLLTKGPTDEFGIRAKVGYASNNELTFRTVLNTGLIGDTNLKASIAFEHHQMDGYVVNTLSDPGHWPGADDTNAVYATVHDDVTDNLSADFRFDYTYETAQSVDYQTTYAYPAAATYFGMSPHYGGAPYVVSPDYLGTISQRDSNLNGMLETLGYSLTLNYEFGDALSLKSISAYRSLAEADPATLDGQGVLMGPVFNANGGVSVAPVKPYEVTCPNGPGPEGCDNQHQWQISQEIQASGTIDRVKYVSGLYYFEEQVGDNDPQSFTVPIPTGNPALPYIGANQFLTYEYTGKSTSYAAYGQAIYTPPVLDDKLQITGGLRFTRDEKSVAIVQPAAVRGAHRFNALSGEATLKYQWTPDIQTYFRFANAYKAGGFNGRDVTSFPNPAVGYAPETANSYEIGTHADFFEHHLRVNADVFYTEYSNQQIATIVSTPTNPAVTETLNSGASTYLGGELEVSVIPAEGWLVDLNFGYVDPEFQTFNTFPNGLNGTPVNIATIATFPYTSKATMDIGLQYTFPAFSFGDLSARVNFGYKSGVVYGANPIANPLNDIVASQAENDLGANVTLANIPLGWRDSTMEMDVYGKNLLNQHRRVQGIDFSSLAFAAPGGFGINAYARPMVIGFDVSFKY